MLTQLSSHSLPKVNMEDIISDRQRSIDCPQLDNSYNPVCPSVHHETCTAGNALLHPGKSYNGEASSDFIGYSTGGNGKCFDLLKQNPNVMESGQDTERRFISSNHERLPTVQTDELPNVESSHRESNENHS